jgi:hypothetical protein
MRKERQMRRFRIVLPLVIVILLVAVGGYALGSMGSDNAGHASHAARRGTVPKADAQFARAAAFVNNEGPALIKAKGFKSVTSPSTGVYCLRLKDTSLKVSKLVPMVSTEWGNSGGNDLLVQVFRSAADCPDHNIEVMTFHTDAGNWVFYDNLSFFVMVP